MCIWTLSGNDNPVHAPKTESGSEHGYLPTYEPGLSRDRDLGNFIQESHLALSQYEKIQLNSIFWWNNKHAVKVREAFPHSWLRVQPSFKLATDLKMSLFWNHQRSPFSLHRCNDIKTPFFANWFDFDLFCAFMVFLSIFLLDKYSLKSTASFNLKNHLLSDLVTMAKSFNY